MPQTSSVVRVQDYTHRMTRDAMLSVLKERYGTALAGDTPPADPLLLTQLADENAPAWIGWVVTLYASAVHALAFAFLLQ